MESDDLAKLSTEEVVERPPCVDTQQSPQRKNDTELRTPPFKYILLSISSHLAWGLYPVFARYFQAARGLDGLIVLAVSFFVTLVSIQFTTCEGMGDLASARIGFTYSLLTCGRAATNMLSCKYTIALNAQLITQLGPFVTAFLSSIILAEAWPRCFVLALVISSVGAIMTIYGQEQQSGSHLSNDTNGGIALAFVSVMFSAGMRIFMKSSSTSLSEVKLISWQFTNVVPMLAIATTMRPSSVIDFALSISLWDCVLLMIFMMVICIFANFSQVASVRHLGPTMASSLQPLRLISTLVASFVCLGEGVQSIVAWIGLLTISISLTVYLYAQRGGKAPTSSNNMNNATEARHIKPSGYGKVGVLDCLEDGAFAETVDYEVHS